MDLKQRISEAAVVDGGVTLDEELHNDMKALVDTGTKHVHSLYPEHTFKCILSPAETSECIKECQINEMALHFHQTVPSS